VAAAQVLASHAPIVEMGAGTGYWAHQLERRGITTVAFDARPPTEAVGVHPASGGGHGGVGRARAEENEFHGDCPAFTNVRKGGPSLLSNTRWREHTLLLCYPPKGQPMGAQAVSAFCGRTVIHVGEWGGDTGDMQLEAQFAAGWQLERRVPLPCWGDTMEDLTVWTRREAPLPTPPTVHPVLACDACGAPAAFGHAAAASGGGGVRLRRCRYCRLACYCSAACALAGSETHEAYHRIKLITVQRPLDFDGRDYCPVAT
jgi:hypothetical protein